jgi:lipopolysaccharide transport system permease protein
MSFAGNVLDALIAPVMCAWRNHELLASLVRRDVQARFRGTVLGVFWAGVAPLVRLVAYTLIFGVLIQPRWQGESSDPFLIAFTYFSGLVLWDFFTECMGAASNLMRDNQSFIKKVVFPVEILTWVVLGFTTFRVLVGMSLLVICYVGLLGLPPVEILLTPLFFVPLAMIALGLMWVVSALATYVRDVGHIINAFLPILMFVSPIFFPLSALPDPVRALMLINPLTFPLEQTRLVLFGSGFHAWFGLAIYIVVAISISLLGYRFFMRVRPGFADVI